jgi:hypothetical protein
MGVFLIVTIWEIWYEKSFWLLAIGYWLLEFLLLFVPPATAAEWRFR